eukprot:scaffold5866_cov93-Isochrysis_galbana.AAC.3
MRPTIRHPADPLPLQAFPQWCAYATQGEVVASCPVSCTKADRPPLMPHPPCPSPEPPSNHHAASPLTCVHRPVPRGLHGA